MSGYPQDNIPAFLSAAKELTESGYDLELPADMHGTAVEKVLSGSQKVLTPGRTWGDVLADDVRLVADRVGGIIFLSGWEKSRGARLEASTGLLCDKEFRHYTGNGATVRLTKEDVATAIYRSFVA